MARDVPVVTERSMRVDVSESEWLFILYFATTGPADLQDSASSITLFELTVTFIKMTNLVFVFLIIIINEKTIHHVPKMLSAKCFHYLRGCKIVPNL